MATDIELFCTSCTKCQMNKTSTQWPKGLLHSLPKPDRPWQSIGIDFIKQIPVTYATTGTNYASRQVLQVSCLCVVPQILAFDVLIPALLPPTSHG
jgi:hypothetical protein